MKRIATIGQNGHFTTVKTNTPTVGSYAQFSSTNARPWSTTAPKKETRKTRRRKKKILHPIFAQCAKISADPFWQDKFDKASYGKLPRGFTMNKNYLIYKRGIKNDSAVVPETPHEAYSVCVYFFQSTAKIYSDQDNDRLKEEERLTQLREQLKERTWAKTLKRQKEVLVELYVQELKEHYTLSIEATKKLEDIINIGILYNYFNKDNILLEDGIITEIVGLIYDSDIEIFVTEQPLQPKTSKSSSKAKKIEPSPLPRHVSFAKERTIDFYEEWGKLLDISIKIVIPKESKEKGFEGVHVACVHSHIEESPIMSTEEFLESTFTPTISTTD